jgi:hypothetical protein
MKKKDKVSKVTKLDKKDSYGNTSFVVEFDNGDKGFYTSKSEDQKVFIQGQEATYIIEEKEGKGGKKYCKVTVPAAAGQQFKGGYQKPVQDPRAQMIGFATSYSKDLVVAGKVHMNDMSRVSEEIFNNMIKLFNTIK